MGALIRRGSGGAGEREGDVVVKLSCDGQCGAAARTEHRRELAAPSYAHGQERQCGGEVCSMEPASAKCRVKLSAQGRGDESSTKRQAVGAESVRRVYLVTALTVGPG